MDKRKLLLLKYLLDNCSDGYKVLDTQKVIQLLKKYKGSFQLFEKDIEYLKQMNYIDLKYIDDINFCLTIKDNSRILQENLKVERGSRRQFLFMMLATMLSSGIMAFLGAFFAILIIR